LGALGGNADTRKLPTDQPKVGDQYYYADVRRFTSEADRVISVAEKFTAPAGTCRANWQHPIGRLLIPGSLHFVS